jgi:iron(III) transport system ATP-binding protein
VVSVNTSDEVIVKDLPSAEDGFIVVRDLVAGFPNGTIAVRGLSLSLDQGQHLSLLGPSGCGKSTTLRCIAGLETPMSGSIWIDGRLVYSSTKKVNVPAEDRGLGMVFQAYAIWPHMTVFENVAYGLRTKKLDRRTIQTRVMESLALVGLEALAKNRATALSGGQQQRVALARSYAPQPKAMLLDEPLSNLDTRLRVHMRKELRELQRTLDITTVYVTHDEEEALSMSDRIVIMKDGRACQVGSPGSIYASPSTRFVADFVGGANIYEGKLTQTDASPVFVMEQAAIQCAPAGGDAAEFKGVAIRTVFPRLSRTRPDLPNVWPLRIRRRLWLGDVVDYTGIWAGGELVIRTLAANLFDEGDELFVHIPPESVIPVRA